MIPLKDDFNFFIKFWDFFTEQYDVMISIFQRPPLLMESGSAGQYEGYIVDILNSLASQNNFTYSIVSEPDWIYGVKNDKGNWNGMMGKLVNKVRLRYAYFSVSLLFVISSRR